MSQQTNLPKDDCKQEQEEIKTKTSELSEIRNVWVLIRSDYNKKINTGIPEELISFFNVIIEFLKICDTKECIIFPEMFELTKKARSFTPSSRTEIKNLNAIEQRNWERKYYKFLQACDHLYHIIFALRSVKETGREKVDDKRNWLKDYLQICARNALSPGMAVTGGIEQMINLETANALDLAPKEVDQAKRVAQHMKALNGKKKVKRG